MLLGVIWGSGYSLARFATTHGVPPLGYAFWQSLGPAIFLTILCLSSQSKLPLQLQHIRFYLISGLIGIALPNTNMYFAAAHLPAGILAVIVNTVPVFTYIIALALREENFSGLRLISVALCVSGIMLMVFHHNSLPSSEMTPWLLAALITPLSFALCAVYSSRFRPIDCDAKTLSAGMLLSSTLLLTPVVLASQKFYPLWPPFHLRDGAIILEIILSSVGYVIFFQLLKRAGAVYYSLVGGVVAITGVFYGWLLFNEQFSVATLGAMGLIILGIIGVTMWVRRA